MNSATLSRFSEPNRIQMKFSILFDRIVQKLDPEGFGGGQGANEAD